MWPSIVHIDAFHCVVDVVTTMLRCHYCPLQLRSILFARIIIIIIISKLSTQFGDDRDQFLFQRLSVLIQRFNAILLLGSFVKVEEQRPFQLLFIFFSLQSIIFLPWQLSTGVKIIIIIIKIIIIIIIIIGHKLSTQSGDNRETSLLFQRLSVLIQRFNAILFLDSFMKEEEE